MNHPTDPTTPVLALIEAAKAFDDDRKRLGGVGLNQSAATAQAAFASIPSISQLLSEHDKVVALVADMKESAEQLRKNGEVPAYQCRIYDAERLQSIVEGK